MSKTELQYRTFDQLMDEVRTDLPAFEANGFIEPASLIKIAQKITYELGLRIHQTHETIIDICNGHGRLPSDFYVLNTAQLCHGYTVIQSSSPSGRHTESVVLSESEAEEYASCSDTCTSCSSSTACGCENVYTVCDDTVYAKVIQRTKFETREYKEFVPLYMVPSKYTNGAATCRRDETPYMGQIKDGFLYTSGIANGSCHISYQGAMEDREGNLLVLDHPMINEYYEYALKERILENMLMQGEDVANKLQLVSARKKEAAVLARSIARMPDFRELFQTWLTSRLARHNKYRNPFERN